MDVVKAKKYAVILFPEEENAVDIISSVWVLPSMTSDPIKVEKPCRYPPPKVRGAKLAKLVKGHIPPSSDWLVLSCRILEEYDDYLEARAASVRAEVTSNLESEVIEDTDGRRQRRKQKVKAKRTNLKTAIKFKKRDDSSSEESNTIEEINEPLTTPKLVLVGTSSRQNHHHPRFQEVVINKLINLTNLLKTTRVGATNKSIVSLIGAPSLPLTSKEDLNLMNVWLKVDRNREALVNNLSLEGGDSVSAVTSSVLAELFENKFAITVSFTGLGTKAVCGIKGSPIYKVLIDAVRGNEGFETATVNQIKEATKNWLRNASDRGGGRAARQRRDAE
ncbi:hypothetical protein Fcan01_18842 [Folsomia candida]|uniref:DUF4806 domain-containing protein n=1 Tax=Folsomia candida TaxID=158441 RepID=A0A226DLN3_FOLCA|nr:hypothetical protein Fcan01_18842 [Folsomia candida]